MQILEASFSSPSQALLPGWGWGWPGGSCSSLAGDGAAQSVQRCSAGDTADAPCPRCRHQGLGCSLLSALGLFPSVDVVNLDLKSTLRVLYNLFTKYKHLE